MGAGLLHCQAERVHREGRASGGGPHPRSALEGLTTQKPQKGQVGGHAPARVVQ